MKVGGLMSTPVVFLPTLKCQLTQSEWSHVWLTQTEDSTMYPLIYLYTIRIITYNKHSRRCIPCYITLAAAPSERESALLLWEPCSVGHELRGLRVSSCDGPRFSALICQSADKRCWLQPGRGPDSFRKRSKYFDTIARRSAWWRPSQRSGCGKTHGGGRWFTRMKAESVFCLQRDKKKIIIIKKKQQIRFFW